ncbi:MAG: hypothetical protein ABIP35_03770 [Ginsengibacter sp.]
MKKLLLLFPLLFIALINYACPACEKQQPAILKGITHGSGPTSNWDYVIVIATALIVVATLYYTIKWLVSPGEKDSDHIKRTVLNFN